MTDLDEIEDGIAVIGLALRVPGADDVEQFWSLIESGKDGIERFHRDKARAAGAPSTEVDGPDYVGAWGVLNDAMRFDARFFGYNDREATAMDPQHRVMMEICFAALEDAGLGEEDKPLTGVFVGCGANTYELDVLRRSSAWTSPADDYDSRFGNQPGFLATRIAYKLNLRGPAVSVQTACSTSLVAVHLAFQALLNHECDVALAGGVSVRCPQHTGYQAEDGGILSPDGICRPFDADANGTVFGNGAGVVVLKRLQDARDHGDRIDAVILGTAVNNDGNRKAGYTAPSVQGQTEAMRAAYAFAGVDPSDVGYIETHGTGTALGDPIEIRALKNLIDGLSAERCALGAVKGTIGHLDAAAGIASLIKAVEVLKRRRIPPISHLTQEHPELDVAGTPLFLPKEASDWGGEDRRIAAVNSLGFGGTNAHVLLTSGDEVTQTNDQPQLPSLLPLSAHSADAVNAYAERVASWIENGAADLSGAASTLQQCRRPRTFRLAVSASDPAVAAQALRNHSRQAYATKALTKPTIAFMFPGQGAQHPGMGAGLYENCSVFKSLVDEAAEILMEPLGTDIRDLTVRARRSDASAAEALKNTAFAQPALLMTSIATAAWWKEQGIEPDLMLGHSVGEYSAAHLAGCFDLETALLIVAERGRLMGGMQPGAMLSVLLSAEVVKEDLPKGLDVAGFNAPGATVVAGPVDEIEAYRVSLQARGITAKTLRTSHAFHSRMMDDAAENFGRFIGTKTINRPTIKLMSNVTGELMTAEEALSPERWAQHLRQPVRIANNLSAAGAEDHCVFLEVGPGSTISGLAALQFAEEKRTYIVSSLPNAQDSKGDLANIYDALGTMWSFGVEVDWSKAGQPKTAPARLPPYAFGGTDYAPIPDINHNALQPRETRVGRPSDRWVQQKVFQPFAMMPPTKEERRRWHVLCDDGALSETIVRTISALYPDDATTLHSDEIDKAADIVLDLRCLPGSTFADPSWSISKIIKGLAEKRPASPIKLAQVTRNAYAVSPDERPHPGAVAIAAILRAATAEEPWFEGLSIDVDSPSDEASLKGLLQVARGSSSYDLFAVRSGRLFVEGAVDIDLPETGGIGPLADKTILITGGLGGVGLAMAEALVEKGARKIALLGRTEPGPEHEELLDRLRKDASVAFFKADTTRPSELASAVADLRDQMGPPGLVIHAAGSAGGGLTQLRSEDDLRRTFAAKVDGASNLIPFAEEDGAQLLFVSSIAGCANEPGRGDYAAANRALDAMAEQAWADGRNFVRSVAWDLWEETGMARATGAGAVSDYRGMARDAAKAVFIRLLGVNLSTVMVSTQDFDAVTGRKSLVSSPAIPATPISFDKSDDRPADLREMWMTALGASRVLDTDDFFALGGDSLLALRLAGQIKRALGYEVAPRMILENPQFGTFEEAFRRLAGSEEGETDRPAALVPSKVLTRVRLTSAQERMWFLEKIHPDTPLYTLTSALRIRGSLNKSALKAAFGDMVARHDAFRMSVSEEAGIPYLDVSSEVPFDLAFHDLKEDIPGKDFAAALAAWVARPIRTDTAPLLKAGLFKLNEAEHGLILSVHHIIWDDTSVGIFLKDLWTAYQARCESREPSFGGLATSFAQLADFSRHSTSADEQARSLQFFKERLAEKVDPLGLPTDRPRPAQQSFEGRRISVSLSDELAQRVTDLAAELHVSPVAVWLAAYQFLLYQLSGQSVQTVGLPSVNRAEAAEGVIGLFLDTVPIRSSLSLNTSFKDHVTHVAQDLLETLEHQALPFERLLTELRPDRDESRAPIFQTMFVYLNRDRVPPPPEGLEVEVEPRQVTQSEYDLSLYVKDHGPGATRYSLSFDYPAALFDEETVVAFGELLTTTLNAVTANPDRPLEGLDLLHAEHRRDLIALGTGETVSIASEATVHGLISATCAKQPSKTAVATPEGDITYAELAGKAAQIASALSTAGVAKGDRVAVLLSRDRMLIPTLLGILQAGAAYVPIDPSFPAERVAFMLEDSGAKAVATMRQLLGHPIPEGTATVLVDELPLDGSTPVSTSMTADDLAYMIYTSGSTGKPKAVCIEHRSAVNFLTGLMNTPGLSKSDNLLAVTTISFDIHVLEVFLPLVVGGTVTLATEAESKDPAALRRYLDRDSITAMQATPATWRMLIDGGWNGSAGLKVFCGGEGLPIDLAAALGKRCPELWNMYGPTETTVWSACKRIVPNDERITVGRPVQNTTIHVVDERGHLCPQLVSGEVVIGGVGVARSYHERPELTRERFVSLPFVGPGRFYRTGDLGRMTRAGDLEILGRIDHQVKVRGFRIELGEIETVLESQDFVRRAVCVVREDQPGDQRLVAYLLAEGTFRGEHKFMAGLLSERLPAYMVPRHFIWLRRFPLTPNKKIDRRALPAPKNEQRSAPVPLKPGLEQELAALFCETLGIASASRTDNFFDLGGHSLLSVRVVALLEERTGVALHPGELIQQTIAQIAVAHQFDRHKRVTEEKSNEPINKLDSANG